MYAIITHLSVLRTRHKSFSTARSVLQQTLASGHPESTLGSAVSSVIYLRGASDLYPSPYCYEIFRDWR
jgi:hypothetical protein